MSRTRTAAILVGAALAIALLAVLRIVIDQRNTITQLRQTLEMQAAAPQNNSTSVTQPNDQAVRQESTNPPVAVNESPTAVQPMEDKASAAIPIDTGALRQEKEKLERRLSATEVELANVKRLSAQQEDMEKAYSGPGTWVNVDRSSRYLTGITISGDGMRRTINAWQNKFEWGEVPFFLLPFGEPAGTVHRQYWRGFAAWSGERHNTYLLVTFEQTGLKVDLIWIPTDGIVHSSTLVRTVEHMTRVN